MSAKNPEITIVMPKSIRRKWLNALRSGKYKQGKGALEKDGKYCCLGVLQCVVDGDVERSSKGGSLGFPSGKWLKKNAIYFGDSSSDPSLPSLGKNPARYPLCASEANDGNHDKHRRRFTTIADAIQLHSKGV